MISIDYPFAGTYFIGQDTQGTFTHTGNRNGAAYDFVMPLNTRVRSVDPGQVISVYESETANGMVTPNYVTVKHFADGGVVYYASYLHLIHNGVIPKVGDTVTTGQSLGFSGNTGFSTRPHLHFQFGTSTYERSHGILTNAPDSQDFLIDFNGVVPSALTFVTGVVPPDYANSLSGAKASTAQTVSLDESNSVGFGTDKNDYIKFVFAGDGTIDVSLSNLIGNTDLKILDANGTTLSSSTKTGTANERITQNVEAGKEYFVWVDPVGSRFSTYDISAIALTTGDDIANLRTPGSYNALAGNDVINGTNGADTIRGGAGADQLSGRGGNDVLIGNSGVDTLRGGTGNDTMFVDNAADVVVETAGQGTSDRVAASISYTLASSAHVELLTTTSAGSTANLKLTGNARSQTIVANAGDNTLNSGGTGGADVLRGLDGNDKFRVHNSADRIFEYAGDGNDRVLTSVDYQLATGVEIETLSTSSSGGTSDLRLTGNKLSQTIIGNKGDNYLSSGGAGGADVMRGLAGNDIYRVYNTADVILENANGGNDRVKSSATYKLGAGVSIESLSTHGSAGTTSINLTGNTLIQSIVGNAGKNVLNDGGGPGADTLRGLKGNDTYIVGNQATKVLEGTGEGTSDRVATSVSYGLAANANIELFTTTSTGGSADLNLTGNTRSQTIIGNAGDNLLNGGGSGGADVFRGLDGNDKFRVHNSGDRIFEYAGDGNDRVLTSVDYQLGAGVEIETLSTSSSAGTSALKLTGNKLAQTIIGNAGNNDISGGGAGSADIMRGLGGNDNYRVYNTADTIIESSNNGADRVKASVDYTLGAGVSVESLTTHGSTGTLGIDLTGNEQNQSIIGNAGNNRIDGKAGTDSLRGLAGADTFVFSSALSNTNIDTIVDYNVAADQIELDQTIFTALAATGPLSSTEFKANAAGIATDATDRIVFDTDSGQLFYDADGTGVDAAQQFASLSPGLALNFDDFDVI